MDKISPVYARFVLRETDRLGIAAEQLLEGTTLDRAGLELGGDIELEDFLRILRNGRSLTGNEQLGLMIGRHNHVIALGQIGVAAAVAPTVREGLQVLENYTRLHVSYIRIELESTLKGLSVRLLTLRDIGEVERFHLEAAVMLVQHYVEMMTGMVLDDAHYALAFARPAYDGEYARCLHSPVSFDSEFTSAHIPSHWLDQLSPYYNADMWEQATLSLARQFRELKDGEEGSYTRYVESVLRSCEPPLPDLAGMATRLHISGRTLNRRLQREGTSFRAIKNAMLCSWARRHLTQTDHSVEAIAALLGYQDTANFRRAFRNIEQCSPGEYRRRAAGTG